MASKLPCTEEKIGVVLLCKYKSVIELHFGTDNMGAHVHAAKCFISRGIIGLNESRAFSGLCSLTFPQMSYFPYRK